MRLDEDEFETVRETVVEQLCRRARTERNFDMRAATDAISDLFPDKEDRADAMDRLFGNAMYCRRGWGVIPESLR